MITDELGAPVPIPHPPTTVVSLVPSLTETLATTLPHVLIGATDYCVHPPDLVTTRVGGSKYPDVDRILALRPQLVLANVEENRREDVERLRAHGIPVWVTAAPATVPAALNSLHRLFDEVFHSPPPSWLTEADEAWRDVPPLRTTAIIPVWRRPWVVLGRDTFAGDLLRRLGIGNAYAEDEQRYPRLKIGELHAMLTDGRADGLILPDEPYQFAENDGPDAFPGARFVLVSGRFLTWWGPSLPAARLDLSDVSRSLA
jgi:ABC-type Fe3+-hydroxamate transport system substrate-binding protein